MSNSVLAHLSQIEAFHCARLQDLHLLLGRRSVQDDSGRLGFPRSRAVQQPEKEHLKLKKLILPTLSLAALCACSSVPSVQSVDTALLIEVSADAKQKIAKARASHDESEDAYAIARRENRRAEQRVKLGKARLKTTRAQLNEAQLVRRFAEKNGSEKTLARSEAEEAYAYARVDYTEELILVRQREFDLAKAHEKFTFEERRLRNAQIELAKAEALKDVDLIAAQKFDLGEYRKQTTYYQRKVEAARAPVKSLTLTVEKARNSLERKRQKMESLKP